MHSPRRTSHQRSMPSPSPLISHPRLAPRPRAETIARMPRKGMQALAALRIPHKELVARAAARGQLCAVGAPGHARDHAVVADQAAGAAGHPLRPRYTRCRHRLRRPAACCRGSRPRGEPRPGTGARSRPGAARPHPTPGRRAEGCRSPAACRRGSRPRHRGSRRYRRGPGAPGARRLPSAPEQEPLIPLAAGQPAPIGTPGQAIDDPAVAAQQPGRLVASHVVDRHQVVGAAAGQQAAVGAPVDIIERDSVALDHAHTLLAGDIPHAQGAILAAAEQCSGCRG